MLDLERNSRQGMTRQCLGLGIGMAMKGKARKCKARKFKEIHGKAIHGKERKFKAWKGKV
jgi:hypothetical protein